jgi:membrane associated rhomboid family serine protease
MVNKSSSIPLDAQLQRLTERVLSPWSRYGHVALLLAALMMCVLLGALLATEPALIARTQAALAVMLGIGACWVAYALWVLRHRRPLLGSHRIVAGRMAVAFTALFLAGAMTMIFVAGSAVFYWAAVAGTGMLALAIAILIQAHRHVARLQARRRELERLLGKQEATQP